MKKYNNIKKILRKQVESNVISQWVWLEDANEFTQVYQMIPPDADVLYSPQQLLNKLENTDEKEENKS